MTEQQFRIIQHLLMVCARYLTAIWFILNVGTLVHVALTYGQFWLISTSVSLLAINLAAVFIASSMARLAELYGK